VIDSPPQVVRLAIDLHEALVLMPLSVGIGPQLMDAFFPDLGYKHRPKSSPPEPDGFMDHVDAKLVQKILDIPK
jgi:hypothetical protein